MLNSRPTLLYATNNKGKIIEVRQFLAKLGWKIVSPDELGVDAQPTESGNSLEENALIKAKYFADLVDGNYIVMADDTGVEIDALDGEPGIYVRRWRDRQHEMTDKEIITYLFERLKGVPAARRGAQFRTVIVLIFPDGTETTLDGVLRGEITLEPSPNVWPGLPFEGVFFVPKWGMTLGESRQLSDSQLKSTFLSHRERAVKKAVELLQQKYR